jgi:hypothetical protein
MKLITKSNSMPLLGGLVASWLALGATQAADLTQTGRDLLAKYKDAVVSVSAMIKVDTSGLPVRMGGGGEGQEIEICGTVVDPSGLTVVSYTTLNPVEAMTEGLTVKVGDEETKLKIKTEITRLKMRVADGTEVSARVVFKDKDLDLAFIVPDPKEGEKAPKFTALEFKEGPSVKELDDLIFVTRLAKKLNYQPGLLLGRVVAVVTKPRTIFDFSIGGNVATAVPVFTPDGKLAGLVAILREEGARRMGTAGFSVEHVIMPAGDVAGLLDQAKKAAAKKEKAEPKDEI